jgi:hypothetical protein
MLFQQFYRQSKLTRYRTGGGRNPGFAGIATHVQACSGL